MRAHAAAVALLVVPLAACGGALWKRQLVAKGDAICKRVNTQIAKEPAPKDAAGLKRLADKTVALSGPAIKDMEALQPPDELQKDFDAFVASLKKQRELTRQIGQAAAKGDAQKVQQIGTDAQKTQAEYRRLSDEIGFKECGGRN